MSAWKKHMDDLKREALNATVPLMQITPEMRRILDLAKAGHGVYADEVRAASAHLVPGLCVRFVLELRVVLGRHVTPDGAKWCASFSTVDGRPETAIDRANVQRIVTHLGGDLSFPQNLVHGSRSFATYLWTEPAS